MSSWWQNLTRPPGGFKKRTEAAEREKPPAPKRETPDGLWIKAPDTGELLYQPDLEAAHWVTPSGFHMRIGPQERFKQLLDPGTMTLVPLPDVPIDPLRFKDDKRYVDRLKKYRTGKGDKADCMGAAEGALGGVPVVILAQDFEFMGGSLGMAAGEAFCTAVDHAVKRDAAMICIPASGGARMQEGILSLMQMPRTTLAIQKLKRAGLPYIVILTDPTTGGVTASYAMLGDIHIAEPQALIGFAGPRVIEQTIRQKLPEGFQRAEFLLEKGMVDMVVDRRQLKPTLMALLSVLMAKRLDALAPEAPVAAPIRLPQRAPGRPPRQQAAE